MIREIKFRGKDVKNGEWVFGYYVKLPHLLTAFLQDYIVISGFDDKRERGYQDFILVEPETVGQFTGLLDKNGKEIYEGDVIEAFYSFEKDYVVKFGEYTNEQQYESHRSGYGYYLEAINGEPESIRELSYDLEDTKIIGNIHD